MKKSVIAMATMMGIAVSVHAADIYIDYSAISVLAGADSMGRYWNVSDNASLTDMVDEDNDPTTVDLVVVSGLNVGAGPYTGGASTLVDWDDEVIRDNWYISTAGGTAQLRFEGLVAGGEYDLTFYGARWMVLPPRTMQVTIGGVAKSYDSSMEGMVTFEGVVADVSGRITVDLTATTIYANLGGIKMVQPAEGVTLGVFF